MAFAEDMMADDARSPVSGEVSGSTSMQIHPNEHCSPSIHPSFLVGLHSGGQVAGPCPWDGRMTGEARALLLAALAEVGVEPEDYALIEQAKILVDGVNARLRARGSNMVYSVAFCARAPVGSWANGSASETATAGGKVI
jgi:hypothetical protein